LAGARSTGRDVADRLAQKIRRNVLAPDGNIWAWPGDALHVGSGYVYGDGQDGSLP
jgi:hypothetical protein